jgi:hypothetical protein
MHDQQRLASPWSRVVGAGLRVNWSALRKSRRGKARRNGAKKENSAMHKLITSERALSFLPG